MLELGIAPTDWICLDSRPMESRDASELLPIGDAARRLGVSVETLRRWAEAGRIPFITLPSGHRRFRCEDIDGFLQSERDAS